MRSGPVLVVALLLLVPNASAQELRDRLADFHFQKLVFTFTWEAPNNGQDGRAIVFVDGVDLMLEGEAARDIRRCIDGQDCVVPELSIAASGADRDGSVSSEELDNFETTVLLGINSQAETKAYLANMRGIVSIDGQSPSSATVTALELENALGSTDSTEPVRLQMQATAKWNRLVVAADSHQVSMRRTETNFTVADRVEVKGGENWRIKEDTIQPSAMGQFFGRGKLQASQEEFESPEPLTFAIEYHEDKTGTYFLWGALGVVAIAAGAGFVWWRRHKV